MRNNLIKIISVVFIIILLSPINLIHGQTTNFNSYIWEYLNPQSISTASNDLKTTLENEVKAVIASGHLSPFRAIYGEGYNTTGQYYWYHTYDTVYTLSMAYPYLSSTTQTSVKTYLQSEMSSYPLWSTNFLPIDVGTKRQPDILQPSESGTAQNYPGYSTRPKLFSLYALWLYANNTGDWTYVNNNWSTIKTFYTNNKAEVSKFYTSISGAIGIARMAYQKSPQDLTTRDSVVTDINTGMTAGKNFATFGSNAETAYTYNSGERWSYTSDNSFMGYQFLDISPEIGRYIFDDSTFTSLVVGLKTDRYSESRGNYFFPLWYMAQGPVSNVAFGEGSGIPPDVKAMLFPLHAWVKKDSASQLRTYLDVRDALLGDYYYMQNITRTIQASGQECWTNINTNSSTCLGITPTTSIPIRGDFNGDGVVNVVDLSMFLPNIGSTNSTNIAKYDLNSSSSVDVTDLSILLTLLQ